MITDRINRWRHRRGFGVHSPAAFMLVRDVVRPQRGYRYYLEDLLDVLKISDHEKLLCRISLRLIGRLGARNIRLHTRSRMSELLKRGHICYHLTGHPSAVCKAAVSEAAVCKAVVSPLPADLTPFLSFDFERPSVGKGRVVIYHRPQTARSSSDRRESVSDAQEASGGDDGGVLYIDGRHYLIVYKTPGLSTLYVTV